MRHEDGGKSRARLLGGALHREPLQGRPWHQYRLDEGEAMNGAGRKWLRVFAAVPLVACGGVKVAKVFLWAR